MLVEAEQPLGLIRNEKTAGEDKIEMKIIKRMGEKLKIWLLQICKEAWMSGKMLEPIYKKKGKQLYSCLLPYGNMFVINQL